MEKFSPVSEAKTKTKRDITSNHIHENGSVRLALSALLGLSSSLTLLSEDSCGNNEPTSPTPPSQLECNEYSGKELAALCEPMNGVTVNGESLNIQFDGEDYGQLKCKFDDTLTSMTICSNTINDFSDINFQSSLDSATGFTYVGAGGYIEKSYETGNIQGFLNYHNTYTSPISLTYIEGHEYCIVLEPYSEGIDGAITKLELHDKNNEEFNYTNINVGSYDADDAPNTVTMYSGTVEGWNIDNAEICLTH